MTDVVIDGIQYVPSSDFETQLEVMRDVLKSQEFLSDSAIENIMISLKNSMDKSSKTGEVSLKNLGKFTSKTGEVSSEKLGKSTSKKRGWNNTNRQFSYNIAVSKLFHIKNVLHDGSVLFEKGNYAKWKIQQAIIIKDSLKNGSTKDMTYADAIAIENKVHLPRQMVRQIMYNIEHGDLGVHIGKWRLENMVNAPKKQPKPIENNPQKRRESGLYA